MYGLKYSKRLADLCGRQLSVVDRGDFVLRLLFSPFAELTLDTKVSINGKSFATANDAVSHFNKMVGATVSGVSVVNRGDLVLEIGGQTVIFLDSNDEYESYTLTIDADTFVV